MYGKIFWIKQIDNSIYVDQHLKPDIFIEINYIVSNITLNIYIYR